MLTSKNTTPASSSGSPSPMWLPLSGWRGRRLAASAAAALEGHFVTIVTGYFPGTVEICKKTIYHDTTARTGYRPFFYRCLECRGLPHSTELRQRRSDLYRGIGYAPRRRCLFCRYGEDEV